MSVYLFATLDTKGPEAELVRDLLRNMGISVVVVDTGCIGTPTFGGDVSRNELFVRAGTSLAAMVEKNDRGAAVTKAAEGAVVIVREALSRGKLDGVIALGGSAGSTIGTAAMRALPIGVPKVMVSTLASGQTRQYVGDKDIFMLNSIVDIAGINRVSRKILVQAAAAMAGLVKLRPAETQQSDRPIVVASMFGVTTPCVLRAREVLEEAGYEVLVFHATGNGGRAMESLIRDGLVAGVLDITTTELADELVGGDLSAGPERLTAAASCGVPQVVSVGALDMVNFGPRENVPAKFADRKFHIHNAAVTLMRTTAEENASLGAEIGRKVAASKGPAAILLPHRGVSSIDCEGQSFCDPEARTSLFQAIRENAGSTIVHEFDGHINDPAFAELAAQQLITMMRERAIAKPAVNG